MRVRNLLGILVLAVAVSARPASAAIIVYNSAAAWQAAADGISTITFEENGAGSVTLHGNSGTFSGVTLSQTRTAEATNL